MGGIVCKKAAIDGGASAVMVAEKSTAALRRTVQCMSATIVMGQGYNVVTEEEESKILTAVSVFETEIKKSFDKLARVCSELEAAARGRWEESEEKSEEAGE